jgi:hypothetical protein
LLPEKKVDLFVIDGVREVTMKEKGLTAGEGKTVVRFNIVFFLEVFLKLMEVFKV